MSKSAERSALVIPSMIPWADLKQEHLEELLYWLLDDFGLRDLRWRRGGSSITAPDGGRDLEGTLYVATPFGELQPQRWWVESKGRKGTVEIGVVQAAVHNAGPEVDVLVVATNTQFSNPTHAWVDDWQAAHPRPKIWLWQREQLEKQVSTHPSAVARLYSEALSPQGRLELANARLWRYAQFAPSDQLELFWREKAHLTWTSESMITVVTSETANGDLTLRPWLAGAPEDSMRQILAGSIANVLVLHERAERFGTNQGPLLEAAAHIVLSAILTLGADETLMTVRNVWKREDAPAPPDLAEFFEQHLLRPIALGLQHELSDVCANDCERVVVDRNSLTDEQVADYWKRFVFDPDRRRAEPEKRLTLEKLSAPCRAGLPLDDKHQCPLIDTLEPGNVAAHLSDYGQIIRDIVRRGAATKK